jgi:hypothetical protein
MVDDIIDLQFSLLKISPSLLDGETTKIFAEIIKNKLNSSNSLVNHPLNFEFPLRTWHRHPKLDPKYSIIYQLSKNIFEIDGKLTSSRLMVHHVYNLSTANFFLERIRSSDYMCYRKVLFTEKGFDDFMSVVVAI